MLRLSSKPTTSAIFFQLSCGPLSKVSANLPGLPGIPGKNKIQSSPKCRGCRVGGGPAAFFANGCEAPAARHRSPAAPARHRSPAKPAPRDSQEQNSRIASFNPVVPGLRETPRGTPRGATPKKWDMPVSSSELHTGSNQKMVGACFQSEALQKHKCHLCFRAHSCPASEASIPSAPHSCRATCPASEPPACQARAKVGILPRKKFFETVV